MDDPESELRQWAAWNQRRDDIVRAAYARGVRKHRIYLATGLARPTIDRILRRRQPAPPYLKD